MSEMPTADQPGFPVGRGIRRLRRRTEHVDFDLSYVRNPPAGAAGNLPVLVIPGGPGLASVLPYRGFRKQARDRGLDVIMVEHRGVGFSRKDLRGRDLTPQAMRIEAVLDDLAAVLDAERLDKVVVAGASYGAYLAAGFAARHRSRVAGLLLDSPMVSTADLTNERARVRGLLWTGEGQTLPIANRVRELLAVGVADLEVVTVLRSGYELGGAPLVRRLLRSRGSAAALLWRFFQHGMSRSSTAARPLKYLYEFDLAGVIGFRELDYGTPWDGLPLDPGQTYAPVAQRFPAFDREPFDLWAEFERFTWPTIVLSGTRDLRTVPEVARRVAETIPGARFVPIENGHSALESHPAAVLRMLEGLVWGTPFTAAELNRLPKPLLYRLAERA